MPDSEATEEAESGPRRPRVSLSGLILAALVAGIAFGLFFGESMAVLQPVADGFVRLLQMAVLPYLTISLIAGLGSLSYERAGQLAVKGGLILLLLWGLCLTVIFLTPLVFPDRESASFFSTALLHPATEFDFISLYISNNPFRSLADNAVPAVVLFCIALGVALIGMPESGPMVKNLGILAKALARISSFVLYLTPIGVFAIAASAAGTMSLEDVDRLQVYVVTYVIVALLLGLWVLPGLIGALTPLRYRDVIHESRDAMVTAFTTGSLFVVLPLISESAKRLLDRHPHADDDSMVDVLVPVSFNFPHAGNLLALVFVLFAGWFSGEALVPSEYPALVATGVASLFAATTAAVPFLLDLFRIPSDMVQIFFVTGVVNRRFATLVAAMHILVVTVLVTVAVGGGLRVNWRGLARYAVVGVGLVAVLFFGSAAFLARSVDQDYTTRLRLTARPLSQEPVASRILGALPPPRSGTASPLNEIRETGVLRVGVMVDEYSIPFTFWNDADQLVGFDIDMAHRLARDLGVGLELVPFAARKLAEHLDEGRFDIAMSGIVIGADTAQEVAFSTPYMEVTVSFLVPDHLRRDYATWDQLRARDNLRIGQDSEDYYTRKMLEILPNAEIVITTLEAFLDGSADVESFLFGAETAASLALLEPRFAVVVPQPKPFRAPLAYAMQKGDQEFVNTVSDWVALKKLDGTIDQLYAYWILGRDDKEARPRWSVIRNVLGWVE